MRTTVQEADDEGPEGPSPKALALAKEMASQRANILIRHDFVTLAETADPAPGARPALAVLASTRGRGAEVALKTYLLLLWRCSKHPYKTEVSARQFATLLDLHDPDAAGRRRVAEALRSLENLRLVRVETRRGTTSSIHLLHESGSGEEYTAPTGNAGDRYFPVPAALFSSGIIHSLRTPALSMLLLLLSAERGKPRSKIWWSVSRWESEITLTRSTRAAGIKQLGDLKLVLVRRELVENAKALTRETVRNTYRLTTKVHPSGNRAGNTRAKSPSANMASSKKTTVRRAGSRGRLPDTRIA